MLQRANSHAADETLLHGGGGASSPKRLTQPDSASTDFQNASPTSTDTIQVVVRIRPPSLEQGEQPDEDACVLWDSVDPPNLPRVLSLPGIEQSYTFNSLLPPEVSQGLTYETCCRHLLKPFLNGYNCCILAYGQTGSGKTYTMGTAQGQLSGRAEARGIIPRALKDIFLEMKAKEAEWDCSVTCSYIEIYNEEIRDLLDPEQMMLTTTSSAAPSGTNTACGSPTVTSSSRKYSMGTAGARTAIRVAQDQAGAIVIQGVRNAQVTTHSQAIDCLSRGGLYRTTGSNKLNMTSSRSHAIFTVSLYQTEKNNNNGNTGENANNTSNASHTTEAVTVHGGGHSSTSNNTSEVVKPAYISSKFHFVDLAGSERVKKTQAHGDRLREGININSGLLALSNVINALSDEKSLLSPTEGSSRTHVPYRDSKLTRLLQDSLGGNSKTVMIACVSSSNANFAETYNTIKYATRARRIRNAPIINKDPQTALIETLRKRIKELTEELQGYRIDGETARKVSSEQPQAHALGVPKSISVLEMLSSNANLTEDGLMTPDDTLKYLKSKLKEVEDALALKQQSEADEKSRRIATEAKLVRLQRRANTKQQKSGDAPSLTELTSTTDEDDDEADLLTNLSRLDELESLAKLLEKENQMLCSTIDKQRTTIQQFESEERTRRSARVAQMMAGQDGMAIKHLQSDLGGSLSKKVRFDNPEDGPQPLMSLASSIVLNSMVSGLSPSVTCEGQVKELEALLDVVSDEDRSALLCAIESVTGQETVSETLKDQSERISLSIKRTDELIWGMEKERKHWELVATELSSQITFLKKQLEDSEYQKSSLKAQLQQCSTSGSGDRGISSYASDSIKIKLDKEKERTESNQSRLHELSRELERIRNRKQQNQAQIEELQQSLQNLKAEKIQIQRKIQDQEKRHRLALQEKDRLISRLQRQSKKTGDELLKLQLESQAKLSVLQKKNDELNRKIINLQSKQTNKQNKRLSMISGTVLEDGLEDKIKAIVQELIATRAQEDMTYQQYEKKVEKYSRLEADADRLRNQVLNMENELVRCNDDTAKKENILRSITQLKDRLEGIVSEQVLCGKEVSKLEKKVKAAEAQATAATTADSSTGSSATGVKTKYQSIHQLKQILKASPEALADVLIGIASEAFFETKDRQRKTELLNIELEDMRNIHAQLLSKQELLIRDFERQRIDIMLHCNKDKLRFMEGVFLRSKIGNDVPPSPTAGGLHPTGGGGGMVLERTTTLIGVGPTSPVRKPTPGPGGRSTNESENSKVAPPPVKQIAGRTMRSHSLTPTSTIGLMFDPNVVMGRSKQNSAVNPNRVSHDSAGTSGPSASLGRTTSMTRAAKSRLSKSQPPKEEAPSVEALMEKLATQEIYYQKKEELLVSRIQLLEKLNSELGVPSRPENDDEEDEDIINNGVATHSLEPTISGFSPSLSVPTGESLQLKTRMSSETKISVALSNARTQATHSTTIRRQGSAVFASTSKRRAQSSTPNAREHVGATSAKVLNGVSTTKPAELTSSKTAPSRVLRQNATSSTSRPNSSASVSSARSTTSSKSSQQQQPLPSPTAKTAVKVARPESSSVIKPSTRKLPSSAVDAVVSARLSPNASALKQKRQTNIAGVPPPRIPISKDSHKSSAERQDASATTDELTCLSDMTTFDRIGSDSSGSDKLSRKRRQVISSVAEAGLGDDPGDDLDLDDDDDEDLILTSVVARFPHLSLQVAVQDAHSDYIKSACMACSTQLATGSQSEVKLWDLNRLTKTSHSVSTWRDDGGSSTRGGFVREIFPCDNTLVFSMGGTVKIVDTRMNQMVHSWISCPNGGLVHSIALISGYHDSASRGDTSNVPLNSLYVCTSGTDKCIRVFDIRKLSPAHHCKITMSEEQTSLLYMPYGLPGAERRIMFGLKPTADSSSGQSTPSDFAPYLDGLVSGGKTGEVRMWAGQWAILCSPVSDSECVTCMSLGRVTNKVWNLLYASENDGNLRGWAWDMRSLESIGDSSSSDEHNSASTSDTQNSQLWNMGRFWRREAVPFWSRHTTEDEKVPPQPMAGCSSLCSVGSFTISGHVNGDIRLWNSQFQSKTGPSSSDTAGPITPGSLMLQPVVKNGQYVHASHTQDRRVNKVLHIPSSRQPSSTSASSSLERHSSSRDRFVTVADDTVIKLWSSSNRFFRSGSVSPPT